MRQLLLFACVLGLLGCSDTSTWMKRTTLGGTPVMLTTADLRLITQRDITQQTSAKTEVICTEPSPDVAKALSTLTSGQGSLSISLPIGGAVVNAGGSGAATRETSESLAQLTDRVPTIQALRDGLYRACEAYANRAIGRAAYALILSRYGELLTTLLLAETLNPHARPALLTLNGQTFVVPPAAPPVPTLPNATPKAAPISAPAAPDRPELLLVAAPGTPAASAHTVKPKPTPGTTRYTNSTAQVLAAIGGNQASAIEAMQFNYLKLNHLTPMLVMCANANDPTLVDQKGREDGTQPNWLNDKTCSALALAMAVSELDFRNNSDETAKIVRNTILGVAKPTAGGR